MDKEKLTVSWDEVNSPNVDARLKEQDKQARQDAFTSPAMNMDAAALRNQQQTSIWYNTAFTMAVFGLLGGLLAWGAGELIRMNPLNRAQYSHLREEAKSNWDAIQSVRRRYAANLVDAKQSALEIEVIRMDSEKNPYFQIYSNEKLTPAQRDLELSKNDSDYSTKGFIANILAYGLCGMFIALALAIAEPVIDRNKQGAMVNGAVGAMLGLIGGVVVSLFIDKIHLAIGGSEDATLTGVKQLLANAIKYGIVGMFLALAPGLLMRNVRKLSVGLLGGLIGGVVGGLLFAPVASLTKSEITSRLIATIAIGLFAGLATGLIENAAKAGWLKVIAGLIAGKQFILYRAATYIGASPDCHIYLFKDPRVGRRHAVIHIVPGGFDLEDLPLGTPTIVNGKPITRVRLRTGDQIQVGNTAFTFQEKEKAGPA